MNMKLLSIEIIPAIDLIEGKCVRLFQGDFQRAKVYDCDPVETAKQFEAYGLKRLHVVDLDGAKSGKISNLKTLEKIATNTNLKIDFGGGVRTEEDLKAIFQAGATQVSLGSIAVKEKDKVFDWGTKYGHERFLVGVDVYDEKIAINGWQTKTDLEIFAFLSEYINIGGFREFFVTDISKDGALKGTNVNLYEKILSTFTQIRLIASGGVACIDDIRKLNELGCSGVIIGKAIYEGKISLEELKCLQSE